MNERQRTEWTRRQFVASSAAVGLACVAGQGQAQADSDNFIDAHVHVWTPDTEKYPLAPGYKKEEMKPASFTPEELFSHCKPHGVNRIVLIQMSFYGYDNSYMLDMIRKHAGVFSGVAVIDEEDQPGKRMAELKPQGVRGFRIAPRNRPEDKWLTGPGMVEMWQKGAELGLAMCPLIDAKFLPSVDKMCEANPDTTVVVDHFARVGIDGVIRDSDLENLCKLARHPNVYVKTSAFYALGKKKPPYTDLGPMIKRVLDAFGPQRLMWASDCPFQVDPGHDYGSSIDLIKEGLSFLSASDRQWLLKKTAEKVFFSA